MTRSTVWITGANGLIGSHLIKAAPVCAADRQIISPARRQLDLTDALAVRRAFDRFKPQLIIHCAALSKSTACQDNPALAKKINVEVTALLAELAVDIPLVFLSSDLVFDGRQGNYIES